MTEDNAQQDKEFDALLQYLESTRGFDFSAYKRSSLMRRVTKRVQTVGLQTFTEYLDYLQVHPEEFSYLFNTVLINVTSFFRDTQTWDYVAQDVVPRILREKHPDDAVRVWSAGCASGEEAYTLAILLAEALGADEYKRRVKIYATDIDEEALAQARLAGYPPNRVEGMAKEMLAKYFDVISGHYVFHKELRRSVIFGRHDLLNDAPISRVDLLVCRNTLMYFNAEAQARILNRFAFALAAMGFLVLGKAEVMLSRITDFTPVDLKRRVFTKSLRLRERDRAIIGYVRMDNGTNGGNGGNGGNGSNGMANDYNLLRAAAAETDPTPQIVADAKGALVLANDAARALLNLTSADIGRSLAELEFAGSPIDLHAVIELVYAERRYRTLREVEWPSTMGDRRYLDITLLPLPNEQGGTLGVKIVFTDVTRVRKLQEEVQSSRQELETANEELQSSNEELETTNEELQSTVEELETTNEELQSTNEELETMNEELQSTNEELEATNEELRQRSDELNSANSLLGSILGSLHDGVIVVDRNLQVMAWNSRSEDMWGLRADEVQGKHLANLDIGLPVSSLMPVIRQCLNGSAAVGEETIDAVNRRGKAIQVKVTVSSLNGNQNAVWGAILMMKQLGG